MDTVLIASKRNRFVNVGIVIIFSFCILFSQNLLISAKDANTDIYTGITPTLNYIDNIQAVEEEIFNKKIEEKYKNFQIMEVEKGIKHIKMIRYYNRKPVRINVVELSTDINDKLLVKPAIASKTLSSKSKISTMAKNENAIVAINGGYFKPQTGVPLGALMIDKKVYTGPIYDRVGIGFFDNGYAMSRIKLNATVDTNIGGFKIDNVNQPRMLSTHTIVYTRDWGKTTPPSPKYGTQLVVNKGKFVGLSQQSTEIPENGFVIVGPARIIEPMSKAKRLKLKLKTDPAWSNVNHIISGGPYLVKDSQVYVDMTAQKLSSIGGRNPRTAIGFTEDNHLILLTADGREGASVGLTLMELANLMKEFGCVQAMNLDGGGSTVMYINGQVVNKPVVSGGIPLSHSLTVSKKG
ncbi:phosphodiester glycosidase family protein [bacterium]|nr:phosphodiester glycosidase family protein [bacterium]